MTKRPLIIFEGADGSGKTSTVEMLLEDDPRFKLINFPKRTMFAGDDLMPSKMVLDDPISLTLFLQALHQIVYNSDPDTIWIMDRSIYSNLAYGCSKPGLTKLAIDWMTSAFDVKLYILDRDKISEDFEDDLLRMPKDDFNDVIQWYRDYQGTYEKIFRTRLIYDGVFDNLKQIELINTIMLST